MFVFNFHTNGTQTPCNQESSPVEHPPHQPVHKQPHHAPPPENHPTMEELNDVVERANQRIDVLERERSYWRRQTQKRERQLQELAADPDPRMAALAPPQPFLARKAKGKGRGRNKGRGKGSGQHGQRRGHRRGPGFTGPIRPLPGVQQKDPTDLPLDELVDVQQRARQRNRHTRPKYKCRPNPVPHIGVSAIRHPKETEAFYAFLSLLTEESVTI